MLNCLGMYALYDQGRNQFPRGGKRCLLFGYDGLDKGEGPTINAFSQLKYKTPRKRKVTRSNCAINEYLSSLVSLIALLFWSPPFV